MEDWQLIRDFVEHRSEKGFSELVERHIDLVYSVALRVVRSPDLAQDVAQSVFIDLARKAKSLTGKLNLAGWLFRSTQFAARNLIRTEVRRRKREAMAMEMNIVNTEPTHPWQMIAPHLEMALGKLGQKDQDALILRFYYNKSLRDVGTGLGFSDDATQKRIERALEKLRTLLAKQGITSTASGLAALLMTCAVTSAPTGLAASIAAGALAAATTSATTTFVVFKLIGMGKLKIGAASALIAAAVALPVWQETRVHHQAAEINQLRTQSAELLRLQREVERLRNNEVDQIELDRLRGAQAQWQAEATQLKGRLGNATRAEAEAAQLRAELKRQADSFGTNRFYYAKSLMMGLLNQQIEDRLNRMTAKLALTPKQLQMIVSILHQQRDRLIELKLKSGPNHDELVEIAKIDTMKADLKEQVEQIRALLSPEQQDSYNEFRKDELMPQVILRAQTELSWMQELKLTPDQQNQAYAILCDQNLHNLMNDVTDEEQQRENRIKAFKGLLTTEQLEAYCQPRPVRGYH